ncbi:MAG: ferredoxin, partial [Clostridia bacterium]|nr:ferredoxin [Clostridia bacterium]
GRLIKEKDPTARVVFIGPCTAKKVEAQRVEVRPWIDAVITFEELQALLDSRDIDVTVLEETPMEDASYFGRVLARTGGLSEAVSEALREQGMETFDFRPEVCDGIEACRVALLKKSKNLLTANFVEGMVCNGGCIGGAGCLMHGEKNRSKVDLHGKDAKKQRIDGQEPSVK